MKFRVHSEKDFHTDRLFVISRHLMTFLPNPLAFLIRVLLVKFFKLHKAVTLDIWAQNPIDFISRFGSIQKGRHWGDTKNLANFANKKSIFTDDEIYEQSPHKIILRRGCDWCLPDYPSHLQACDWSNRSDRIFGFTSATQIFHTFQKSDKKYFCPEKRERNVVWAWISIVYTKWKNIGENTADGRV